MKQKWRNRSLERGVVIDKRRGYVYVRFRRLGRLTKELVGRTSETGVIDRANFRAQQIRQGRRRQLPGFEMRPQRLLIEDAADLFFKLHGQRRASVKGVKQFARYVRLIKEAWSGRYIDGITAADVAAYRAWRKTPRLYIISGRHRESVASDSTINREHTALVTFFNKLAEWSRSGTLPKNILLPEGNPARAIRKINEDRFIRERLLSDAEFSELMRHADERLRRIILAEMNLPLRLEDLRRLRKSNINYKLAQLKGVQAKTGREYSLPINQTLWELIRTAPGDQILDFSGFERRWRMAIKRSGLRGLQFRDLRRTAATALHDAGEKLRTISAMLGHASVTTTIRYLGLRHENLAHAGELLASKYSDKAGEALSGDRNEESVPESVPQTGENDAIKTAETNRFDNPFGGVAQLVRAAAS